MITAWFTLGLPVRNPRITWIATLVVLVYYMLSCSRDLSFYDSAELAMVAEQLGLGHPIGQPTHTMLGFLASHVPGLPSLVGLNWLSAIPAALLIVPTMSVADALAAETLDRPSSQFMRAAVITAYAFAWTTWEAATRIEVYALATFLSLWTIARVAAHVRQTTSYAPAAPFITGVALGLTAATNAYIAVLTAAACAFTVLHGLRTRTFRGSDLVLFVLGAVMGLTPYFYVPITAHRSDVFVWGALRGQQPLSDYFLGTDYSRNRGIGLHDFFAHAVRWQSWGWTAGVLPLAVLGITGHFTLGHEKAIGRTGALTLFFGTVALLCSHVVFAPDIADYIDYLMPALTLASAGTAGLVGSGWANGGMPRKLSGIGLVAVCALICAPRPSLFERTRFRDHAARVLAEGALRELPPNAVLVAAQDHWVAPLLYLQEAEHMRPDVVVLGYGLLSSSWYWDFVYQNHIDLPVVQLRGEGGKVGRLRRFLALVADRPVYFAEPFVAREVGARACDIGFSLATGSACDSRPDPARAQTATRSLAAAMNAIDRGSPSSDEALSEVALARAETLLRLHRPSAALHAALAGIPPSLRPAIAHLDAHALEAVPAFAGDMPTWREDVPLGDSRRCLMFAAFILGQAHDEQDKNAFIQRAADLRLPEATE